MVWTTTVPRWRAGDSPATAPPDTRTSFARAGTTVPGSHVITEGPVSTAGGHSPVFVHTDTEDVCVSKI